MWKSSWQCRIKWAPSHTDLETGHLATTSHEKHEYSLTGSLQPVGEVAWKMTAKAPVVQTGEWHPGNYLLLGKNVYSPTGCDFLVASVLLMVSTHCKNCSRVCFKTVKSASSHSQNPPGTTLQTVGGIFFPSTCWLYPIQYGRQLLKPAWWNQLDMCISSRAMSPSAYYCIWNNIVFGLKWASKDGIFGYIHNPSSFFFNFYFLKLPLHATRMQINYEHRGAFLIWGLCCLIPQESEQSARLWTTMDKAGSTNAQVFTEVSREDSLNHNDPIHVDPLLPSCRDRCALGHGTLFSDLTSSTVCLQFAQTWRTIAPPPHARDASTVLHIYIRQWCTLQKEIWLENFPGIWGILGINKQHTDTVQGAFCKQLTHS